VIVRLIRVAADKERGMHDASLTPFATHPGMRATARMHVRLSPSCRHMQVTRHIGVPEQGSLVGVLLHAASCNAILVFNAHSPTTCSPTRLCVVRLHRAAFPETHPFGRPPSRYKDPVVPPCVPFLFLPHVLPVLPAAAHWDEC
jgi:hypothetical protein